MATKKITMQAIKILLNIPKKAVKVSTLQQKSISFDEPLDLEALALFNSNGTYKKIFGENKKNTSQARQRLSVVKITNEKEKRTIYRRYVGKSVRNLKAKYVGLSTNAWQQLCLDKSNSKVTVTKGCFFPFFWNHSNSATRVSFRMGIIAIAISIIGIILPFVIG